MHDPAVIPPCRISLSRHQARLRASHRKLAWYSDVHQISV